MKCQSVPKQSADFLKQPDGLLSVSRAHAVKTFFQIADLARVFPFEKFLAFACQGNDGFTAISFYRPSAQLTL